MGGCNSCCKRCLIRCCTPLPACVVDIYVRFRVGRTPPAEPRVLFVSEPGVQPVDLALAELPVQQEGFVRIVIISDTHERHRCIRLPEGDVLIHCGDILMSSSIAVQSRGERVLRDFASWLNELPHPEKVVIGGNHDTTIMLLEDRAVDLLKPAHLLQDSRVYLDESHLAVYGNARSEGHSHNDAWQEQRRDYAPEVSTLCQGVDVVVTHHCTPSIKSAILAHARPQLWASGHAHGAHGVHQEEDTLYVNAAVLDNRYRPWQAPVVVDLRKK